MIQWLRERQCKDGLTDIQFATRLGLTRSHWVKIKFGRQKALSHRIILGALAAYPEHREDIIRMVEMIPVEVSE